MRVEIDLSDAAVAAIVESMRSAGLTARKLLLEGEP